MLRRTELPNGGEKVHNGTVEERALRQAEIGDGFAVLQPFDVRPVFLRHGPGEIARRGIFHVAHERGGKDLIDIGPVTMGERAVGQGDADRRRPSRQRCR